MALSVTNSPILPENVIGLSRSEAVDYQWKQIRNWPLQSEVYWIVTSLQYFCFNVSLYFAIEIKEKYKK